MKKTTIVIPSWKNEFGTETEVLWVKHENGSCAKKRDLLDSFRRNNYQSNFAYSNILEMFSHDKACGLFATYERNYTYLEAKGDIDTKLPTSDDLFKIAGFVFGIPITREELEKILGVNNLQSLFASGSPEVLYYEIWLNPRYEKNLKKSLEEFALQESHKMFLNCITIEIEKSISIKRTLSYNTKAFIVL